MKMTDRGKKKRKRRERREAKRREDTYHLRHDASRAGTARAVFINSGDIDLFDVLIDGGKAKDSEDGIHL